MTVKVPGTVCEQNSTKDRPDGTFRFDAVVPGSYFLVAQAEKFVGIRGIDNPTAVLAAGQQISDIVIQLNPQAIISGKVADEARIPVINAAVEALVESRSRGQARLLRAGQATTDKSGLYTLTGLNPGRYYISAQPPQKDTASSAIRFYYPSALSPDQTTPMEVEPGQSYDDTNIRTRPASTHRIDGRVLGVANVDTKQNLTLRLEQQNSMEWPRAEREVSFGPDGTFDIDGVLPGSYMLRLKGATTLTLPNSNQHGMFIHLLAKQQIDVGGTDVTGVVLTIPPPIAVSGRVVLDGSEPQDLSQTQISMRPADTSAPGDYKTAKPQADGTFIFAPCDPSQYAVQVSPPPGTYVETIEFNRQDAMAHLMDLSGGAGGELMITLRKGPAELSGTIQPATSASDRTASQPFRTFALIPANWNPEVGAEIPRKAITNNSFLFTNVAPGQYVAIAVEGIHRNMQIWGDPDFIHALQSEGQAVDLRENDSKQITLPMLSDAEVKQMLARLGLNQGQ